MSERSMGVDISIGFVLPESEKTSWIDFPDHYARLGSLDISQKFWSIPSIKELGVETLTMLGDAPPVFFHGWDGLAKLGHELGLLSQNLVSIDFDPEYKAYFLANLTYCYQLLRTVAPSSSSPVVMLG